MLMSHLQDSVAHADAITQITYNRYAIICSSSLTLMTNHFINLNRTMVQLGLCGFRHSEIKEAHNALLDIQLGGRSKELLAQGLLPQVNSVTISWAPIFSHTICTK